VSSAQPPARQLVPLLLALVFVALVAISHTIGPQPDAETRVLESACRLLLDNTTEGRQALVGSIWRPPVPFLLRLPLVRYLADEALASRIVSVAFGLATLGLLYRIGGHWNLGRLRLPLLGALALNPLFVHETMNGSSRTTVAYLTLLAAQGLARWVDRRSLQGLIYAGFACAFMIGTSPDLLPWVAALQILILCDLLMRSARRGQREAALILGLLPAAYALGVWCLMNWLILGDPFYFVRSMFSAESRVAAPIALASITWLHKLAGGLCGLALLVGFAKRNRALAYVAAAGLCLLLLMPVMARSQLPWDFRQIELCLTVLTVLAAAQAAAAAGGRLSIERTAWAWAPVSLALAISWSPHATAHPADAHSAAALPGIRAHVLHRSPYAKVFVCGYDSFRLLRAGAGPLFTHVLDFNLGQLKNDYFGHDLYVLIHRPRGRSATDSVHWKHDRIFTLGTDNTLYDRDWGDWRLFEIIQARR